MPIEIDTDNLVAIQLAAELTPHETLMTGDQHFHDCTRLNTSANWVSKYHSKA